MTTQIIEINEMPIELQLPPIAVGADYSFTIEIEDDNDQAQPTTDWEMKITARDGGPNGEELFTLDTLDGIVHTPSIGRFVVNISHTITSALGVTKAYWDCQITDQEGKITYPFIGAWDVISTVTR